MDQVIVWCSALALVAIVQATLLPPLLFGVPVGGALLNGYLTTGLTVLLVALVGEALTRDGPRHAFEQRLKQTLQRRSSRLRTRGLELVSLLLRLIAWPAYEYGIHRLSGQVKARKVRSQLAVQAAATLFPLEVTVSLFLLGAAVGGGALVALLGGPQTHGRAAIWLILLALALKHLSHLLSPQDMQQRLRSALGDVRVNYALITFTDLFALLICYHMLLKPDGTALFDWAAISSVYQRLRVFKDIFSFDRWPSDTIGWIAGVSGGLWLWTLFNALLKLDRYSRTLDDQLNIAGNLAMLGREAAAREALATAEGMTATQEPNSAQLERLALIPAVYGDFPHSAHAMAHFLKRIEVEPAGPSHVVTHMAGAIAVAPDPGELLSRYIDYAAGEQLSDAQLTVVMLQVRSIGVDPSTMAAALEQQGLATRYPLSLVALKWLADEEREVLGFFDSLPQPADSTTLGVWLGLRALLLPARRMDAAAFGAAVNHWLDQALPELEAAAMMSPPIETGAVAAVLERANGYLGKRLPLTGVEEAVARLSARAAEDLLVAWLARREGNAAPSPPARTVPAPPILLPQPPLRSQTAEASGGPAINNIG